MNSTVRRDNRPLRVYYLRAGVDGPITKTRVTRSGLTTVRAAIKGTSLIVERNPSAELLAEWDAVNHPTGDTFGGALLNKLKART